MGCFFIVQLHVTCCFHLFWCSWGYGCCDCSLHQCTLLTLALRERERYCLWLDWSSFWAWPRHTTLIQEARLMKAVLGGLHRVVSIVNHCHQLMPSLPLPPLSVIILHNRVGYGFSYVRIDSRYNFKSTTTHSILDFYGLLWRSESFIGGYQRLIFSVQFGFKFQLGFWFVAYLFGTSFNFYLK